MVVMARVRYKSSSPYVNTNQTSWYLDFYKDPDLLTSEDDPIILIEPKYEYRPDLLSFDLYGTPRFWWVFQLRNMDVIKDPIWDLKSGMEIYAPSADSVKSRAG